MYYQVADKFYEPTNIRQNITSAYHPQANGDVERFNRTIQECFMKCQEFHDEVQEADVLWHKKLQSILFAYRVKKQASTCISHYMIMCGRELVLPWDLEGDLTPLDDPDLQDLSIEKIIDRMYHMCEQILDVAAANVKRSQKIQARAYNAKHTTNAFEVGERVWRKNPQWNIKQKLLKKGPKWYSPYKVVERKDGGNGNYLLIPLS